MNYFTFHNVTLFSSEYSVYSSVLHGDIYLKTLRKIDQFHLEFKDNMTFFKNQFN